jgi:hypothetical protein
LTPILRQKISSGALEHDTSLTGSMPSPNSSMSDQERPCSTKRQRRSSPSGLRRSVEPTANGGLSPKGALAKRHASPYPARAASPLQVRSACQRVWQRACRRIKASIRNQSPMRSFFQQRECAGANWSIIPHHNRTRYRRPLQSFVQCHSGSSGPAPANDQNLCTG